MLENLGYIMENAYLRFFFRAVVIIIIFLLLKITSAWYIQKWREKVIKGKETTESKRSKETRIAILNKLLSTLFFILTFLFILAGVPQFRTFSYSLLASAGVLAIVIGFATQKTLSNVISGIFLALYEPFRIGDKIQIFGQFGEIEDLTLRHTIIRTWDNRRIMVPNSKIDEQEITNFSIKDEMVLWTINMGISYDSDIDKAKKIMVEEAKKHTDNLGKKEKDKQPFVRVTECGDFSVNLRLYFWCEDAWTAWKMGFDLVESTKKEFDKRGIEIPFPYRTIVYKKDLEARKRKRKLKH